MSDQNDKPSGFRSPWTWVTLFVALAIAYPLSIGPVSWYLNNHALAPNSFLPRFNEIFYVPLFEFAKSTGTVGVLQPYIAWWINLGN